MEARQSTTNIAACLGVESGLAQGSGFRAGGFRVQSAGFRVQSAGFRVLAQGSGYRLQGLGQGLNAAVDRYRERPAPPRFDPLRWSTTEMDKLCGENLP